MNKMQKKYKTFHNFINTIIFQMNLEHDLYKYYLRIGMRETESLTTSMT